MKAANVLFTGKKFIPFLFVLLGQFFSEDALAQVKFFAVASQQNLSVNQPFQVQYVVQGTQSVSKITVANTSDFRIEDTFSTPLTTVIDHNSFQWVESYSKIVVLSPTRTGRFLIPSASVVINGVKYKSGALKVNVTQTGLSSILSPESIVEDASDLKAGENVDEKVKNNFFLRAIPVKKSVYVGEPIQVDYKAYSRLNSNSQVVKRPAFPGFSVVEMVDNYDNKPDVETVKGIPFYTNLIRKVQLFPLQEGEYSLDAAEIESVIHFRKVNQKSQLESLLEGSNGSSTENYDHHVTLRTIPEVIKVKPLPTKDQPEDFAGAVGQFDIKAELPHRDIRKGELTTVRWVITGRGNLQLITLPDVQWPKNLDTSEPSVKEEVNRYVYPLGGKKIFEYSFSVKDTGKYTIPAMAFSYFDPETEKYNTLRTDEISFHAGENATLSGISNRELIKEGEQPVHLYFFGAIALIVIGWITYQLIHLNRSKKEISKRAEQLQRAATVEEQPDEFRQAKKSLSAEEKIGFYNEVQRVIWKTVAEKCSILPSALNKTNLAFRLRTQDVPETLITELSGVLGECEWALYTPETNTADMRALLERAENALVHLEHV